MPVTAADLQSRVGRVLRVKIATPGTPSQPTVEYTAQLTRVWSDLRIADFYIGYTTIHPSFDDIISIEGGLQPLDDPRNTVNI